MPWWKDSVAYQIYPRSFQDTNGDGIGDLPGIRLRLPLLRDLGIGILWLSPVYASPNDDNGYDISDYRSIHPDFGTMEDMRALIRDAQSMGIRIIMDLVINHTSDEHPWFQASRDPDSPYRDYYIWKPGKNGGPPNNWTGFFAGSTWDKDDRSGTYYLHLFSRKQPDLNYRNPKVLAEVLDIMRFWLDMGISGFRCDVINVLFKSSLEDGRKKLILTGSEHYLSQEGTHELLRRMRSEVWSRYDCFTVGETVFVSPKQGRDLCDPSRGELDMIFSFEHMETDQFFVKWFKRRFRPANFGRALAAWQTGLAWNANYFENHDQPRSITRFGNDQAYHKESGKMLALLLLSLRGTPFIYQGQEIGMTNYAFRDIREVKDVESLRINAFLRAKGVPTRIRMRLIRTAGRDTARTPMQWNREKNAGFTTGNPWLLVNPDYTRVNYEDQLKDPESILFFYRSMIALRRSNTTLKDGSFLLRQAGHRVFSFDRVKDSEKLTVLVNFSAARVKAMHSGSVMISTYGRDIYDGVLLPYEGIILRNEVASL